MRKYGIIYKIQNKLDGKIYIGQTVLSLDERIKRHAGNKYNNSYIASAIIKYGIDAFNISELCEAFSADELNDKEQFFIEKFQSLSTQYGYNLKTSGSQPRNNSDIIEKCRIKQIGRKHTNNKPVKFTNKNTGESFIIRALEDVKDSKEFRIKGIRKLLAQGKNNYKQYIVEYVKCIYVNQSGSPKLNKFEHAQRLEGETVKTEHSPSTSYRTPKLKIKPHIDEIINLYVNEKLSAQKIGKIYSVNKSTILRHLKAYNVDTFKNSMFNSNRRIR